MDAVSDYIKREDAVKVVKYWDCYGNTDINTKYLIDSIERVQTADVVERSSYESMEHTVAKLNEALSNSVEVVRCKDCKHRKKNTFCLHNMRYEDDNGFCSYGEKGRYER